MQEINNVADPSLIRNPWKHRRVIFVGKIVDPGGDPDAYSKFGDEILELGSPQSMPLKDNKGRTLHEEKTHCAPVALLRIYLGGGIWLGAMRPIILWEN